MAASTFDPTPDASQLFTLAANQPPTVAAPSYAATEGQVLNLRGTGISIGDPDAGGGQLTATFSVSEGLLAGAAGSSGVQVSGAFSSSMTVTGSLSQLNAFLGAGGNDSFNYRDFNSAPSPQAFFTITVHDNGHTGSGGDMSASANATINIAPVNTAPFVYANPSSPYAALGGSLLDLKNNGILVFDQDAGSGLMTLTVTASEGVLDITAGSSGAAVSSVAGGFSIDGTLDQLNALLNTDLASTVSYHDDLASPSAATTLTFTIDDNGNTPGPALTTVNTATIDTRASNNPIQFAQPSLSDTITRGIGVATQPNNPLDGGHPVSPLGTLIDLDGDFTGVSVTGVSVTGSDANAQAIGGALHPSLDPEWDGTSAIQYFWSSIPDSALDGLLDGESITVTAHVVVTDRGGASDAQDVNLQILGRTEGVYHSGLGYAVTRYPDVVIA